MEEHYNLKYQYFSQTYHFQLIPHGFLNWPKQWGCDRPLALLQPHTHTQQEWSKLTYKVQTEAGMEYLLPDFQSLFITRAKWQQHSGVLIFFQHLCSRLSIWRCAISTHQPWHHLAHLSTTEMVWPSPMVLFFPKEIRQLTLQFQLVTYNELLNSEYHFYCWIISYFSNWIN